MIQFRVPQKSCFSGSFLLKIASHGQTVHFRLYSVIHNRKALVISFHMVFFKNFNVDPARRQIFGNASAEKCIPDLRVCPNHEKPSAPSGSSDEQCPDFKKMVPCTCREKNRCSPTFLTLLVILKSRKDSFRISW